MITAGIDCGARNTKTVIMRDRDVLGNSKVRTASDPTRAVEESLKAAVEKAEITREDIDRIAGTGSGEQAVVMADVTVDHIQAMTRGAKYLAPEARTVVDVGAEVGRAATMDEKGNVQDVVIQEECAAGAGTFIETMARALEVSLEEMGTMALQSSKAIPMNAQCVVFAESEVIGLIHGGADKRDISKSVHDAVAGRIVSMVQRMGVKGGVILMGGMARNPGFVTAVKQGLKLENVYVPKEPEYGAAIGASIAASEYP